MMVGNRFKTYPPGTDIGPQMAILKTTILFPKCDMDSLKGIQILMNPHGSKQS